MRGEHTWGRAPFKVELKGQKIEEINSTWSSLSKQNTYLRREQDSQDARKREEKTSKKTIREKGLSMRRNVLASAEARKKSKAEKPNRRRSKEEFS